MLLFDLLSGRSWPPESYLNCLASGIADRCMVSLPKQAVKTQGVALAETKGNLRARVGGMVRQETRSTLQRASIPLDFQSQVVDRVVDEVTRRLLLSTPHEAIASRKAA